MTINDPGSHERISINIGIILIGLLGIEYILGMINNLYVHFPETGTEVQMWEFAWKQFSVGISHYSGYIFVAGRIIYIYSCNSDRQSNKNNRFGDRFYSYLCGWL